MISKLKAKISKSFIYDPKDKRCDDCGYVAVWVARDLFDTIVACRYKKEDCEKDTKRLGYEPVYDQKGQKDE